MRHLRQITVIGLGLLGSSICLAVSRRSGLRDVKTAGYTHRPKTRAKAARLKIADVIYDDIRKSVAGADLVILATPICIFEQIFNEIKDVLPAGCIVTDVGSTKLLPCKWAAKIFPKTIHYVGSHPIAGSEQRGVEFGRDDLFDGALCILTPTQNTNRYAVSIVKKFWQALGCSVKIMTPSIHDRIFANVSHLPHITAAALVNASSINELKFAGRGFMDTSRIASGPANIWTDVLLTNAENISRGIDHLKAELTEFKKAINANDRQKIQKLLESAVKKRQAFIKYKMNRKELNV